MQGYEKRWCFSCGDTGDISPPAVQVLYSNMYTLSHTHTQQRTHTNCVHTHTHTWQTPHMTNTTHMTLTLACDVFPVHHGAYSNMRIVRGARKHAGKHRAKVSLGSQLAPPLEPQLSYHKSLSGSSWRSNSPIWRCIHGKRTISLCIMYVYLGM